MQEKVSILIPNYNSEKFLAQTIDSAINQTYKNIEIIIVDNCSTDDSWHIIETFALKDKRIKAYRNKKNIGPVKNWDRCIGFANGKYAKILWSDDYMAIDFIEKTIGFIEEPEIGFVFTQTIHFSNLTGNKHTLYNIGKTGRYATQDYQYGILIEGKYASSPGCAIFRLEDLKKNLLIDVPNKINSDFSLHAIGNDMLIFLLTSLSYKYFGYVDKPLSFFREHGKSITTSSSSDRIAIFYHIAKAYFIENYLNNHKILLKFNTILFSILVNYRNNGYGVKKISDFYLKNKIYNIDYVFLVKKISHMLFKSLFCIKDKIVLNLLK